MMDSPSSFFVKKPLTVNEWNLRLKGFSQSMTAKFAGLMFVLAASKESGKHLRDASIVRVELSSIRFTIIMLPT